MGLAIDTVLGGVNTAAGAGAVAALTAVTFASGDSGGIRNFGQGAFAKMYGITSMAGTGSQTLQVRSPMLHDNVRGIQLTTEASPSVFLLPRETGQALQPNDTLIVEGTAAANTATAITLHNYYSDLPGVAARLHSWGDISGLIGPIKPLEVDVTTGAASNDWADTGITTTEDLLKANTDYAVLGVIVDAAVAAFGIKGPDTGNLRICAPGPNGTTDTSDFFVRQSQLMGLPMIPVFNSANKNATYVSTASNQLATSVKGQLILAELISNVS